VLLRRSKRMLLRRSKRMLLRRCDHHMVVAVHRLRLWDCPCTPTTTTAATTPTTAAYTTTTAPPTGGTPAQCWRSCPMFHTSLPVLDGCGSGRGTAPGPIIIIVAVSRNNARLLSVRVRVRVLMHRCAASVGLTAAIHQAAADATSPAMAVTRSGLTAAGGRGC
jgi:hypothetical protein